MLRTLTIRCLAILLFLQACGEDGEVFETLSKLRGLGVESDKLVVPPSTTSLAQVVTLTLHAVVPVGDEVKVETFIDSEQKSLPVITDLEIVKGSQSYKDYTTLRHMTVQATFTVPTSEVLQLKKRGGAVSLRYGFLLSSKDEVEKVVGNFAVADSESADGKLTWTQPSIKITGLKDGDSIARSDEREVSVSILKTNPGESKIGWFTSSGTFKNRRAKTTVWKNLDAEKQLLIATYREKRSRAFAIDIIELKSK